MKLLQSVFFIASFSLTFLTSNSIHFSRTTNSLLRTETSYPVEKIYVHTDRSSYLLGDDIWFKVYLVNGKNHRPETTSKMVYVELIDPFNKIVSSRTILIKNGGGEGEFPLPISLATGMYTLRAYTNYMRNFDASFFFTKPLNIGSYQEIRDRSAKMQSELFQSEVEQIDNNPVRPDVQFFPEGGYMVNGLPCRLGFKAIDGSGNGIDIKGALIDRTENELMNFESMHLGMGSLLFEPEARIGLRAKIYHQGNEYFYDLPKILDQGVIMRLVDRGTYLQINLQSSLKKGLDKLVLLGQQKGDVVVKAELKGGESNGVIRVPLSDLQDGLIKFTLLDSKNEAICERLAFVEKSEKRPLVRINSAKEDYSKRELVNVEFDLYEANKSSANVSVSVTEMTSHDQAVCSADIRSYLLINSEVKGNIEEPCYYLGSSDPQRKRKLDILLLTQGWRNYLWREVAESKQQKFSYPFEIGKDFKGSVRSVFNHDVPAHSQVSLTYTNRELFGHDEGKTFENGRFLFPGYLFTDSTSIIIQAKKQPHNEKGVDQKKGVELNRDFHIELDSFIPPEINFQASYLNKVKQGYDFSIEAINGDSYLDSIYANQEGHVQLEGVELKTVTKKALIDPNRRGNMRYVAPSKRVDYKEQNVIALGNDLFWGLKNWVPGLQSRGGGLYYRGSKVDFFLDGVRFENANSLNTLINADDVSFIDVLSGPQAAAYSSQAAIMVYSKTAEERTNSNRSGPRKGIVNFIYPGLYEAKKFYEPRYTAKDQNAKSDYRVTLHWEPTLILNPKNPSQISFYTADPSTTYRIQLEGITSKGEPLKSEAFFRVGE